MRLIETSIIVSLFILSCFAIALADDCDKAVGFYNKGTRSQDYQEKERLFKEALTLSCADSVICANIHNNLGDAYENVHDLTQAIEEYKKAIQLAPSLSTPYSSLGDVYSKIGNNAFASEYYNKFWNLVSLKTRAQLADALSLRSRQRSIAPVPKADLYFGFNEATIAEESKKQLEELLAAISGNELRSYTFELSGHTCDIGTDVYNQKLSERRADAVKKWLVAKGYPTAQLTTKGFGKKSPIADNATEEGKKLNRRVEIRTTGTVMANRRSTSRATEFFEKGRYLSNRGKYPEAASAYEAALDMFKNDNSIDGIEATLGNLYLMYLAAGRTDKALECQRQMRALE